ncbi:MAG: hypothetical protein ACE5KA_09120 [Nitrososphaerales archaeon]
MSTIVTLEDKTNGVLKRREVRCLFKGLSGGLTRKDAAEMLARELKLDKGLVIPISLISTTGTNDIGCVFYIYDDEKLARRHLPKYVFMRMLSKEERKKAKEAQKAKGKKPSEGAPAAPKEKPKESKEEKAKEGAETEVKEKAKTEDKSQQPKNEAKGKNKPEEEAKE